MYNTTRYQAAFSIQSDISFSASTVDSMWFGGFWFWNVSFFACVEARYGMERPTMSENILIYDTIKRFQRYRYFTQLRNGKGIQTTLNSLGKKRDFHRHNNRNGTTSICDVCNSIREDIQYGSRAEAGVEEFIASFHTTLTLKGKLFTHKR